MQPFRILSIDGGGIRGLHPATVLESLAKKFAQLRGAPALDVGKGFDLIAGTSTGGIIACALAHGCPPKRIAKLYRESGARIFAGHRIPDNGGLAQFLPWAWKHRQRPIHNPAPLREELTRIFGGASLRSVFEQRQIALCIPSLSLLRETPRVFKTPHLDGYFRDDAIGLVDVCLATSAAPIFLPLAKVADRHDCEPDVYADGGLWMNNPSVVALLEALEMTPLDREIHILSIGTCSAPVGGNPGTIVLERGLMGWGAGSKALELSMNAQAGAASEVVRRLVKQFNRHGRKISFVRGAETPPAASQARLLTLDNASNAAVSLLSNLGQDDANKMFQWVQQETESGTVLKSLFDSMPALSTPD